MTPTRINLAPTVELELSGRELIDLLRQLESRSYKKAPGQLVTQARKLAPALGLSERRFSTNAGEWVANHGEERFVLVLSPSQLRAAKTWTRGIPAVDGAEIPEPSLTDLPRDDSTDDVAEAMGLE